MTIAAIIVEPAWTIPPAVVIGLSLVWYWLRLGRADVPPSRRRVRRLNTVFLLLSLPLFVRALSFLDPEQQPRAFLITWSILVLVMLMVIIMALLDAMNSLRLHHHKVEAELRQATANLILAAKTRRDQTRNPKSETRNKSEISNDQ